MKNTNMLKELSGAAGMGGMDSVVDIISSKMEKISEVERLGGSLVATIKGKSDYTVLFDAHIDEIGFVVTSVSARGFVKAAKAGGIDIRVLPAAEVIVHGTEDVPGVFATLPPHLKKGEDALPELADMVIDTGREDAKKLIKPGDRITFRRSARELLNGAVTGKSLDDRAGVVSLILAAQTLAKKKPPVTVKFLFSDEEELGCLGAQTAAFALEPDEAVAVDVSFGDGPDIPPDKCGKLWGGPMIGISPVLSEGVTTGLQKTAADNKIKIQSEAMGGKTSTNADVIALSRSGIPCGLVSIPLRNMHTAAEVVSMNDIKNVASLLAEYVLSK